MSAASHVRGVFRLVVSQPDLLDLMADHLRDLQVARLAVASMQLHSALTTRGSLRVAHIGSGVRPDLEDGDAKRFSRLICPKSLRSFTVDSIGGARLLSQLISSNSVLPCLREIFFAPGAPAGNTSLVLGDRLRYDTSGYPHVHRIGALFAAVLTKAPKLKVFNVWSDIRNRGIDGETTMRSNIAEFLLIMGTPHTSLREWGSPRPFGSGLEPNAASGSDLLDIVAIWSLLPAVEHVVDLVDVRSVDVLARLVATLLTSGLCNARRMCIQISPTMPRGVLEGSSLPITLAKFLHTLSSLEELTFCICPLSEQFFKALNREILAFGGPLAVSQLCVSDESDGSSFFVGELLHESFKHVTAFNFSSLRVPSQTHRCVLPEHLRALRMECPFNGDVCGASVARLLFDGALRARALSLVSVGISLDPMACQAFVQNLRSLVGSHGREHCFAALRVFQLLDLGDDAVPHETVYSLQAVLSELGARRCRVDVMRRQFPFHSRWVLADNTGS